MSASLDRVSSELADYIKQASAILGEVAPGASLVVVSGYRSTEAQARLRDRFLSGDRRGIASEPAVASRHTLGRAVDLQIRYRGQLVPVRDTPWEYWQFLAELLEPVGVRWGGRFKRPDPNHFDI